MSTQPAATHEVPGPGFLMSFMFGEVRNPMLRLPILRAGIELEVWAKIAGGYRTAKDIACAVNANQDGMRLLLDALTVMKLLKKQERVYSLPDWAEYYLLPDKPTYMGNLVLEWLAWERNGQLSEAIRSGKRPIIPDVTSEGMEDYFIPFCTYISLAPERFVKEYDAYWRELGVEPREGLNVLDLACGAGAAVLSLAVQHPGVSVVLQDWPVMLDIALEIADKLGVEKQVSTLPGDMLVVEFGKDKFDIVRLGYVSYFYGPDDLVTLFHKIYAALVLGGTLVIEAAFSDESRCENESAVLWGPWLFAISDRGDVYTLRDYENFLGQAGFVNVSQIKDDLVKAVK